VIQPSIRYEGLLAVERASCVFKEDISSNKLKSMAFCKSPNYEVHMYSFEKQKMKKVYKKRTTITHNPTFQR
jgi:hypothetical protein